MQSTKKENEFTKQEILEIFQDVRKEYEDLKQTTVLENTKLKRKHIMNHFDSFRNAKFELRLWESDYVNTNIEQEIDVDYQFILIKLLEICEKENGKVTTKIIDEDENMPKPSDYRREFESLSMAKFQADLCSDSVINLTDEQLECLEDDMINLIQKCEKENNHVSLELVRNMNANIKPAHIVRHFGSFSKAKLASLDNPRQIHLTSNELKSLDEKLRKDNYRIEIINGLIMGDGYIGKTAEGKNNSIEVETTNETYLKYLEKELGDIVIRVTQSRTKEEIAEKNRKHGYTVNEDKINDEYVISTRNLPIFSELRKKWYSNNGKKAYPDDLELTPTTVRHWYIGDGSLNSNEYCVIYASNEKERPEYMESLFDDTPFNPSYNKCGGGALQFTRKESPEFLQWIGEPAQGYEYKWDIKR